VFKVCDEPHPQLIKNMLHECVKGSYDQAYTTVDHLWKMGYSGEDIITNIFRVVKTHDMNEFQKLEFIKLIAETHLRIVQGINSLLQLSALVARMCRVSLSVKD